MFNVTISLPDLNDKEAKRLNEGKKKIQKSLSSIYLFSRYLQLSSDSMNDYIFFSTQTLNEELGNVGIMNQINWMCGNNSDQYYKQMVSPNHTEFKIKKSNNSASPFQRAINSSLSFTIQESFS